MTPRRGPTKRLEIFKFSIAGGAGARRLLGRYTFHVHKTKLVEFAMRLVLIASLLVLAAPTVQASTYDLGNPAILGQYTLATPDSSADLQKAELIYNNDNQLVVVTERNEEEYLLTGPNAGDVVYSGEGEPNCDGDEPTCYYDVETTIKLTSTTNTAGETIPQLAITITVSDAWIEDGSSDATTTYVLNWAKTLPYQIPYYVNVETPADLKALVTSCNAVLGKLSYDGATGYLNVNDVCPWVSAFQYREPQADAIENLLSGWVGSRQRASLRELNPAEVKTVVFDKARALASKYQAKDGIAPQDIVAQLDLVEAFTQKADRVYYVTSGRHAELFLVRETTKSIVRFQVAVSRTY